MSIAIRIVILSTIVLALFAGPLSAVNRTKYNIVSQRTEGADKYFRTELYFGRDRPTGPMVSEEEWRDFINGEVTPRFPDGFTVLEGRGQYRDKKGTIVRENSKVIVFLFPKNERKAAGIKIEEIRAVYCKRFDQESVLRIDFRRSVEVDF